MEIKLTKITLSFLTAALITTCVIADKPTPAASAIDKGLTWLKDNQKENGAWSNESYPGLTALGLWALTNSDREDIKEARDKAAKFIAGFAQEDGGIYKKPTGERGSGGLSVYNTAISMAVLQMVGGAEYTPIILKARDFMEGAQVKGDSPGAGGFGYGRPGENPRDRADLSNTGWALMAMRVTQGAEEHRPKGEKNADISWDDALSFVDSLQIKGDNPNTDEVGGFTYEGGGERGGAVVTEEGKVALRGFGSMTYAGLESMIYAQVGRDDPRVRSAIEWAGSHWTVLENPGMGLRGLFYYYTILAKSLSLLASEDALRTPEGKVIPWKTEIAAQLVSSQDNDGSWINSDNTFWEGDPSLVTAYALIVLQYATK